MHHFTKNFVRDTQKVSKVLYNRFCCGLTIRFRPYVAYLKLVLRSIPTSWAKFKVSMIILISYGRKYQPILKIWCWVFDFFQILLTKYIILKIELSHALAFVSYCPRYELPAIENSYGFDNITLILHKEWPPHEFKHLTEKIFRCTYNHCASIPMLSYYKMTKSTMNVNFIRKFWKWDS